MKVAAPGNEGREKREDQAELVRQMVEGQEEAYGEFWRRYGPRLMGSIVAQGVAPCNAESLTVTTITKAAMKIGTFAGKGLWPWLTAIARHEVIEHWRQQARLDFVDEEALELLAAGQSVENEADEDTDGMERVAPSEEAVRDAKAKLPRADVQVISLRFGPPELTAEEVGRVLGMKAGTVRQRLRRALQRLKVLLMDDVRVQERMASRSKRNTQREE